MEKKIFKVNRKYMRIVLRFLKETGLLPLWQEYFYLQVKMGQMFTEKHWSNVTYVDHVLGNTTFTQFVAEKLSKRDGVTYDMGIPIYFRFAYWLQKMGFEWYGIHPDTRQYLYSKTDVEMSRYIIIDPITKKTQLIFNKKRC
jgi:hypothetical protein